MATLSSDLQTLTTIPEKAIQKLFKKMEYCMVEAIHEDQLKGKEIAEIDVGYGKLYVKIKDKDIKYKFEPNPDFGKAVEQTVLCERNLLQDVLNETLVNKFIDVYKDICD